jgi:hypothetical protein
MATLAIAPNGAGYENAASYSGATFWESVQTDDGDTSTAYSLTQAYNLSTATLQDHASEAGIIDNITVYHVSKAVTSSTPYCIGAGIRTNSSSYFGSNVSALLTTSYQTLSTTWYTNPNTLAAWTWAEIDALEAGVYCGSDGTNYSRTTRVYVVVTYTATTDYTRTSTTIRGNKVTASRIAGFPRTSTTIRGNKVTASRTLTASRASTTIRGVKPTASRLAGVIRSASAIFGNKVSAVGGRIVTITSSVILAIVITGDFLGNEWVASAATAIGEKITATRSLAIARVTAILQGVSVAAGRIGSFSRTSARIFGIAVSAAGGKLLNRAASVIVGAAVSASRTIGISRAASAIFGQLPSAARVVASIRTSAVLFGEKVSASIIGNRVYAALVVLGNAISASRIAGYPRTAAIKFGTLVSASVFRIITRTASIKFGEKVTASRAVTILRTAINSFGNKVSTAIYTSGVADLGHKTGKTGSVIVGGTTISGIGRWQLECQGEVVETTNFGSGGHRTYVFSVDGWVGFFEGLKDAAPLGIGSQVAIVLRETSMNADQSFAGQVLIRAAAVQIARDGSVRYRYAFAGVGAITMALT